MGNFIKENAFGMSFYPDDEFCILNIGYDDFSFVKPLYTFRMQNYYTWHFVLSGSGTLEIEDKKYAVTEGQMFYIPPDTKMRYYPDKENPWEYVWFTFKGERINEYSSLVGMTTEKPVCDCVNFQKINFALKRMLQSLMNGESGYFGVLSAFYEIMEISTALSPLNDIQRVKKIIDENFASPAFSIEQLCRDVSISHAHLLRLFKKAYGVTLVKYIIKKRLELACELLQTTALSVSSVAYSCGFSDEIHFMKTFKKEMGVSALKYKKAR
ncbi:MAG: AraC family transcriptional regulator [Clostridia bacterium]|nr:AraC family transcriptional regulator [Clostridia bacterium]